MLTGVPLPVGGEPIGVGARKGPPRQGSDGGRFHCRCPSVGSGWSCGSGSCAAEGCGPAATVPRVGQGPTVRAWTGNGGRHLHACVQCICVCVCVHKCVCVSMCTLCVCVLWAHTSSTPVHCIHLCHVHMCSAHLFTALTCAMCAHMQYTSVHCPHSSPVGAMPVPCTLIHHP